MPAGELRERLTFQKRIDLSGNSPPGDGYGNMEGDFADEFTVAANVRPRLGGEQVLQARLTGTNLVNITVRHSAAASQVTPAWRCFDIRSGRVYNIRSIINPDQRRRYIEMLSEASDEYLDLHPFMLDFSRSKNSGYLALLEDI